MPVRKQIRQKYFVFLFFIIFLGFTLCVFAASLVSYSMLSNDVEQWCKDINERNLKTYSDFIDAQVYQNARRAYLQIVSQMTPSQDCGYFLYNSVETDMRRTWKAISALTATKNSCEPIGIIRVYYATSERLLLSTDSNGTDGAVLYDTFYSYHNDLLSEYDDLLAKLPAADQPSYFYADFPESDSGKQQFRLSRRLSSFSRNCAAAMFYFDCDSIIRELDSRMSLGDTRVFVMDTDGRILLSSEEKLCGMRAADTPYAALSENAVRLAVDGVPSIVGCRTGENGWRYFSVTPLKTYSQNKSLVLRSIGISCLAALAVGAIAAVLFALMQYKPVRPILTQLDERSDTVRTRDVYSRLNQTIRENQKRQARMTEELTSVRRVLYDSFVLWFLTCLPSEPDVIRQKLTEMGVTYPYRRFTVVALKAVGYGKERCDEALDAAASRVCAALERRKSVCDFCHKDGMRLGIVNDNLEDMDWECLCAECFADPGHGVRIYFAFSAHVSALAELSSTMEDVLTALSYSFLYPERSVQTIPDAAPEADFDAQARKLAHTYEKQLRAGNYDNCALALAELCESFRRVSLGPREARSYLLTIVSQTDDATGRDFTLHNALMETFDQSADVFDFQSRICLLFDGMRTAGRVEEDSAALTLVREARTYIETHIDENQLSLPDVARSLGVSPSYLSHVFSLAGEETFVEYVSRQRIECAKRLLRDTELSVADISDRLGYSSPQYFRGRFKLACGVTPSAYRDICKANSGNLPVQ